MAGVLKAKVDGAWIAITGGPAGPTGSTGAKGDKGDKGDQGIQGYMAPLVVKSTPPVAADYGQPSIPLNAVWIQSP